MMCNLDDDSGERLRVRVGLRARSSCPHPPAPIIIPLSPHPFLISHPCSLSPDGERGSVRGDVVGRCEPDGLCGPASGTCGRPTSGQSSRRDPGVSVQTPQRQVSKITSA
jgi:hypothetical protein